MTNEYSDILVFVDSLAEDDIGEISDDGFDPPPLMNTSGGDGKVNSD